MKKKKRIVMSAIACIQSSLNNMIITITDLQGNILCWESSGAIGFKGTRKKTHFAAQYTGQRAALKAKEFGIKRIHLKLKGFGNGREPCIRALKYSGLEIRSIQEKTGLRHNGCRLPKRRQL